MSAYDPAAGNKAVVAEWLDRAYRQRDPRSARHLAAPGAFDGLVAGADEVLRALDALGDPRVAVESLTAQADAVTSLLLLRGTPGGGAGAGPVEVPRIELFRVAGKKIVGAEHSWDPSALTPAPAGGEPVLEVDEVQGNVLAGFNKNWQTLVFLQIVRPAAARAWLRGLEPQVSTTAEVLEFNRLYKAIRRRRGRGTLAVRATWTNVAFTFQGLRKLRDDADLFTDAAFRQGMHARAELLGDPVEPDAPGHPGNWVIGSPDRVPDLVVIFAGDDPGWLGEEVLRFQAGLNEGLEVMYVQQGATLPYPMTGHEHFGFKDGVSQPGIRGRVSDAPSDWLTPRGNPADPGQGEPGQDLVWPGEFVFGYPGQDPDDVARPGPVAEAGPGWARNGSFLVFRKMRQDVPGFDAFVRSAAERLAREHPALAGLTPEKLAARLVGRWKSGAPVVRTPDADLPELARDDCADNHFDYVRPGSPLRGGPGECSDDEHPRSPGDPAGVRCPHAAHIRKAYPRDDPIPGGGRTRAQMHRLLRRGIAYGPPPPAPEERGLLFMAYQTSFERQFEFVQRNWLNNEDFLERADGWDPLCGQNNRSPGRVRTFALPVPGAGGRPERVVLELPADWIVVRGGAYFFAPSISALRLLAAAG